MWHVSGSAASVMIHVGHHLDPRLYHLSATRESAPVWAEHCRMDILHVAPQGVPSEQRLGADAAVPDQVALGVRAVHHRAGDVVKVWLLRSLEGLSHRDEII